jgi:diguanylate cyclase (GGDEF)-like protein
MNDVYNWRRKDQYPFVQSAYLFLNSLPLASLRERYKTYDSGKTSELDYIASCFKKFGAIHKMPYAWVLKMGSSWHRYKKYKESNIDILTGAFTHDEANHRGKDDIARSYRNKESIGFIMIDIDYFKRVNDHYGHLAGDLILKKLSQICKKEIRNVDTFARFGGEEFLAILPGIDNPQLKELANRLRVKIEKFNFKYLDEKINVNISAGTSLFDPTREKSKNMNSIFLKYVKRADDAMYIAKAKGRNRVIQWNSN